MWSKFPEEITFLSGTGTAFRWAATVWQPQATPTLRARRAPAESPGAPTAVPPKPASYRTTATPVRGCASQYQPRGGHYGIAASTNTSGFRRTMQSPGTLIGQAFWTHGTQGFAPIEVSQKWLKEGRAKATARPAASRKRAAAFPARTSPICVTLMDSCAAAAWNAAI